MKFLMTQKKKSETSCSRYKFVLITKVSVPTYLPKLYQWVFLIHTSIFAKNIDRGFMSVKLCTVFALEKRCEDMLCDYGYYYCICVYTNTRLPNVPVLNRWLRQKIDRSSFRLSIEVARKVNNCCMLFVV